MQIEYPLKSRKHYLGEITIIWPSLHRFEFQFFQTYDNALPLETRKYYISWLDPRTQKEVFRDKPLPGEQRYTWDDVTIEHVRAIEINKQAPHKLIDGRSHRLTPYALRILASLKTDLEPSQA